jgi:hypothetical protein
MQHVAVYFCLAFFVISEFEFYRACINCNKFNPGFDPIKYFLVANVEPDHVFPVSRDSVGFDYIEHVARPDFEMFSKSNGLQIGQWLLLSIFDGIANVLFKHMLNASSGDEGDHLWAMVGMNVFLTTNSDWARFLHLPLLRVAKQGFWRWVGWFTAGGRRPKLTTNQSQLIISDK